FVLVSMFGLGMVAGGTGVTIATFRRVAADPEVTGLLVRSLALGLGVAMLAAASDGLLSRLELSAGRAAAGRFRRLAKAAAPPPIAMGVVVLALGRLATLAAAVGWIEATSAAGWLDG